MVLAYHLVFSAYGFWLPNDPRGSTSREVRIANIKELYKTGRLSEDVPLDPGDIVYVPKGALGTMQDIFSIISPALDTIESLYIIDSFGNGGS